MNIKLIQSFVLSAAVLLISQSVMADEFSADTGKRPITLGLGVLHKDKPYKNYSSSEKSQPVPIVLYQGEHFFARGGTIGWDFMESDPLEVSVIAQAMGDSYDSSDSRIFKGNGDRDASFGLGGQVVWKPENLGFQLSAVQDVTDNSDGAQVIGGVFYTHKAGPWMFKPGASIVWQSDDYNDYYYGVRSKAVNAAPYTADSDFNYRLGVVGIYQQPTSPWMFIGGLRYEFLGDEISDSTLVSEDTQLSALIGVAYTFR